MSRMVLGGSAAKGPSKPPAAHVTLAKLSLADASYLLVILQHLQHSL